MKNKPVFFSDGKVLKKLDPDTIVCLEANRNYTKIFIEGNDRPAIARCTLDKALEKLPPGEFIKVHRTYIVSVYFIEEINRDHLIVSGASIPIGKQFYRQVMEALTILK